MILGAENENRTMGADSVANNPGPLIRAPAAPEIFKKSRRDEFAVMSLARGRLRDSRSSLSIVHIRKIFAEAGDQVLAL
jgi:hypothetical protein